MEFLFVERTKEILNRELRDIESDLNADLLFYFGSIYPGLENFLKKVIEELKQDSSQNRNRLLFMLTTNGGSVETVERIVNVLRYHYEKVDFIIPDQAMSAGTVLALSGDDIYMDYSSALGPIDPQVFLAEKNRWVPVRGYLEKVKEFIGKAKSGDLTDAEFLILKDFDMAQLVGYEQACNLTVDLLKKWLATYKFKDWLETSDRHTPVTDDMRKTRAKEIAEQLGNNNLWLSHGRYIDINRLQNELKLKINDYSTEPWRKKVSDYFDMMMAYIREKNMSSLVHTRKFL